MTISGRLIAKDGGERLAAGRAALAILRAAVALSVSAAAAQDTNSVIEQVPVAAGSPANGPEMPAAAETVATGRAPAAHPAAVPQIQAVEERVVDDTQLTQEDRAVRSPTQLHTGGRSAQASEPLSQRSEGRTGTVERVTGSDRCNLPQTDPAIVRACARAIETRAAEFARPAPPPLSPEQRLLVDQRLQEGRSTVRTAVRRLAEEGEADTVEGQAVASVAIANDSRSPAAGRRDEEGTAVSAETRAVIEALVGGLVGNPPQPK
jgi:hypothetical protein